MFALSKILVVCYGIGWVASGWFDATPGVVGLALATTLLTLPFFLISSARKMLAGFLISALIGLLIFVFPPVAFLAGVWAGISLVLKLTRLVRNFVPMAAGVGLYALVAVVPRICRWPTNTGTAPIGRGFGR